MKRFPASGRRAACLAVAFILVGSGAAEAQASGEIRVRVVDVGGNPVEEADVRVVDLGRVLHVEGDEEARFERVPAGEYLIEVESPRAGRGIRAVRVIAGETVEVTVTVSLFFHGQELVVSVGGAPRPTCTHRATSSAASTSGPRRRPASEKRSPTNPA
ncbi:hypothetical protein [Candidatus Palauibacter sp.]|uniref:hypothetical protein n=1 Tax=Candidatus Palauibacter sp. TaxID=3101350 RepID=UPI003CC517D6